MDLLRPPSSFWPDEASRKAFDRPFTVDRTHTIPYIAGYNKDGATIYLDRTFPQVMRLVTRTIEPAQFVVLHERVEKAVLSARDVKYQTAHSDYATKAEHEAMAAQGLTPADIASYDAQMSALGRKIAARKHDDIPADLDTTPYRDTNNMAVLKAKTRDDLPASDFVFPATGEFPYEDLAHGRAALRLGGGQSPSRLKIIKAKVYARYPELRPGMPEKANIR